MEPFRKTHSSDVSDEEWALVVPYLTLLPKDAGQRMHTKAAEQQKDEVYVPAVWWAVIAVIKLIQENLKKSLR